MWPTMRATARPRAGGLLVVVIAFVPVGVGHDRLPAHFVERDLLRAVPRGGGNRNRRDHRVRIRDRPFERLHAAHRSARDRQQPLDAQRVDQHLLQPHHVADRDHRERHRVRAARRRIDRAGPVVPRQPPSTLEQMTK